MKRHVTGASVVVIAALALGGCAGSGEAAPTPTPTPTSSWVTGEPAFDACVELYNEMSEWRDEFAAGVSAFGVCRGFIYEHDVETLEDWYGDPEWVAMKYNQLLGEVDPIEPHYVFEFLGTGDATITWSGADTGMIQRQVTLPYSIEEPTQDRLSGNVVQYPTSEGGVGCRITVFSNAAREGIVKDEVLPTAGHTLASCSVS